MARLSTTTREELVAAAGRRYVEADRPERGRILDELTSLTGLHRKHAARLLRGGGRAGGTRRGRSAVFMTTRCAKGSVGIYPACHRPSWRASGFGCRRR